VTLFGASTWQQQDVRRRNCRRSGFGEPSYPIDIEIEDRQITIDFRP